MKEFYAALSTELMKTRNSKMLPGSLIFFGFIAIMLALLMLVVKHPEIAGNSAVLATKASFISKADWPTYFSLLLQMALTLGAMGPAIVTIWVFGREYSDRTVKDLLVLPVSRINIVVSKFIIVFLWSILLLCLLFCFGIIAGLVIRLDGWNSDLVRHNIIVYSVSSLLTILLFPVVTIITCMSRGYLLPTSFAILMMIMTQFIYIGFPIITPYFPWAVPGLYSGVAGPFSPKPEALSYVILGLTSFAGIAGTAAWWRYADQH
ncbi:MAG: ABC transporter permease [Bacteroidales bacterium]|jgi:ABC-2 type transport system permease protein|nr:ABC transporter permease [Bacteroidales bacterium]